MAVSTYSGQYEAYVYKVNKEIEAGERELATRRRNRRRCGKACRGSPTPGT